MTKLYSGSSKNSTYMALLSASPFYKLNDKVFWIVNMDSQQRFLKTHIGHFRNHIAVCLSKGSALFTVFRPHHNSLTTCHVDTAL